MTAGFGGTLPVYAFSIGLQCKWCLACPPSWCSARSWRQASGGRAEADSPCYRMHATARDHRLAGRASSSPTGMLWTEVGRRLGVTLPRLLGEAQARARLELNGLNQTVERALRTRLQISAEQLNGIPTLVLVAAAIVSAFLGDVLDAVVILSIVFLDAVLGYVQE